MSDASPPPAEEVLFLRDSDFQEIRLTRESSGHLSLTLDRVWQFHEKEEAVFHAHLADAPAVVAPRLADAAILGGGDGLAARNLLRYPELRSLVVAELDPLMAEMTLEQADMRQLSEDALRDPRVELQARDARALLDESEARFDLLIADFPTATQPELIPLFEAPLYAAAARALRRDGVLSVQVSREPAAFWPILAAVETSFAHVWPSLVHLDADDPEAWASFVLASNAPLGLRREARCPVSHFRGDRLEGFRIRNRQGTRFETHAYGDQPDFDEEG